MGFTRQGITCRNGNSRFSWCCCSLFGLSQQASSNQSIRSPLETISNGNKDLKHPIGRITCVTYTSGLDTEGGTLEYKFTASNFSACFPRSQSFSKPLLQYLMYSIDFFFVSDKKSRQLSRRGVDNQEKKYSIVSCCLSACTKRTYIWKNIDIESLLWQVVSYANSSLPEDTSLSSR